MKGMPLPFDFEGKGALDLELVGKNTAFTDSAAVSSCWGNNFFKKNCFFNSFGEPTSVLDSAKIPSRPTSTSTLSASLGGGGSGGGGAVSTDTAGLAAVSDIDPSPKWQQDFTTATSSNSGTDSELLHVQPFLEIGGGRGKADKCAMEDWESVLSESVAVSPSQEQSIFRWIMGDVEFPSMGSLNKVFQINGGPPLAEVEFTGGFGGVDQVFGGESVGQFGANFMSTNPTSIHCSSLPNNRLTAEKIGTLASNSSLNLPNNFKFPNSHNIMCPSVSNNPGVVAPHSSSQPTSSDSPEMKPPIFNPQLLINQHQNQHVQNPSFFLPLSYAQQQEHNPFLPPQTKKHNSGGVTGGIIQTGCQISKVPFLDTGQEFFAGKHQLHCQQQQHSQILPQQLQFLPHYLQQVAMGPGRKPKMGENELGHCDQQQQAIIDQLYKAAELVQTGNLVLAQGILARLNHQLSPIGKHFQRAAFYCKEALQLLLHNNNLNASMATALPFSLIFKIGAYKSFSEISPLVQFSNFTCNQAVLEVSEGFDRIHIVDFDIGYGGQWASLMQELVLRSGGALMLKITALASPATHDQLELGLTRENLNLFAHEINIAFEFEVVNVDFLNSGSWSLPFHVSDNDVVAVNLPVGTFSSHKLSVPSVLHFVKQLSPRIVVSVDRGCDRTDLPFANHIIHTFQSYSNLLESLDAVTISMDALQKIERFLLQPGIEQIVMSRFHSPEKTQHWRTLFLSSGFSPVTFSSFTESQAECVVKRTSVRGFQVEKRQSSLVLCWQRKELVSVSAWRC